MNAGVGVERRAAKGVNKPGPERSGGDPIDRKNKAGQEKGVWASFKTDDKKVETATI